MVNKEYMPGQSARWDVRVNARIQSQVRVHARTNRQVLGHSARRHAVRRDWRIFWQFR